jgi:lipopolysaccharide export system protein LptA
MTTWQKRARAGVAIFGIAVAVVVYRSIGSRPAVTAPPQVQHTDPKATAETGRGSARRYTTSRRDFEIAWERSLSYDDGSEKLINVQISVPPRSDGRSFVVTADEARAGAKQNEKELTGHVRLVASDGFEMTADRATHSADDGVVRVPGAVMFKKGRMSGSGTKGTYDQNNEILTIAERAAITVVDDEGHPTTDFTAGSSTLDRLQHVLTLDTHVHVVRGAQVVDSDHSTARLAASNEVVTYLELRGNSKVTGGSAIQSMSARDIDMDYSEDGRTLERVVLNGNADVTPTAQGEGATRSMAANALEVLLAPDGSIISTTGRDNVRLDLPPSGDSPGGRITARAMDATGQEGRGLTEARFTDAVEYHEPARRGASPRVLRAQALTAMLADDAVTDAVFTGNVVFEETDLSASAPEVRYQPSKNAIALSGPGTGLTSHVTLDQIVIDARQIDVALETRRLSAKQVKTTLRPDAPGSRGQGGGSTNARAMPGLLRKEEAASVNAEGLEYVSATGQATYTGNARLFQGSTSISGEVITIDRERGDLVATGSARSALDLESGRTTGGGHEIKYVDASRTVTYSAAPVGPTRGRGVASAGGTTPTGRGVATLVQDAQVTGSQGDLHAGRIDVVLAKPDNRMERLEASTNVTLKMETKSATGARLTYNAAKEQYVISGERTIPATVVVTTAATSTAPQSCREWSGRTLTFDKSTDTIIVDGNAESRTDTRNIPCALPTSR